MANTLFSKGKEGLLNGTISLTGDVRAMLVRSTYTFNDAHVFVSDLGAVDNGRTATLTGKTYTNGVFDADDTSLTALSSVACNAIILYQHNASDSLARLISYIDGKILVEIAANASAGATLIWVENLTGALANGAVMTRISGTGPATITLNETGEVDERDLNVLALSSEVIAGAVYEVSLASNNFPFTPSAGQIVNIIWDNGSNRIFRI